MVPESAQVQASTWAAALPHTIALPSNSPGLRVQTHPGCSRYMTCKLMRYFHPYPAPSFYKRS